MKSAINLLFVIIVPPVLSCVKLIIDCHSLGFPSIHANRESMRRSRGKGTKYYDLPKRFFCHLRAGDCKKQMKGGGK